MYLASWSGGKDSCLACYKALRVGHKVTYLINFISKEYKRVSFHGIEGELIKIQSELAGIPLYQKETTPDNYENEFKEAVRSLINKESNPPLPPFSKGGMGGFGINGMVFGDIYLKEHKDWVERVCGELGLKALEPLWGINTEKLLSDFIDEGFRSIVVSAKRDLLDKEWIGKLVDRNFMEYLKSINLDPCGENGEYHTFVLAGPLFKGRIDLVKTEVISKNDHWLLDIKDYRVNI